MFGLGIPEIVLLVLLALVVFGGGKKFAEMGKGLGEGIRNFKTAVKGDPAEDADKTKKDGPA
jgi:sec-independent protein translocase protein TatA